MHAHAHKVWINLFKELIHDLLIKHGQNPQSDKFKDILPKFLGHLNLIHIRKYLKNGSPLISFMKNKFSYKESFLLKYYSSIGYILDKREDFIQIFFIFVDVVVSQSWKLLPIARLSSRSLYQLAYHFVYSCSGTKGYHETVFHYWFTHSSFAFWATISISLSFCSILQWNKMLS